MLKVKENLKKISVRRKVFPISIICLWFNSTMLTISNTVLSFRITTLSGQLRDNINFPIHIFWNFFPTYGTIIGPWQWLTLTQIKESLSFNFRTSLRSISSTRFTACWSILRFATTSPLRAEANFRKSMPN